MIKNPVKYEEKYKHLLCNKVKYKNVTFFNDMK